MGDGGGVYCNHNSSAIIDTSRLHGGL